MSLHSWQTTLLKMLPNPQTADPILAQESEHLTLDESDNLRRMRQSVGLEVTRDTQIWWRQARLKIAIPFSMHLIQRLELHHFLELYQKQPCITLFFLREAQAFNDFIQNNSQVPIILRDLVQFECTLHQVHLERSSATSTADQPTGSDTTELSLSYCPEACLTSLLNNNPLPQLLPSRVTIQFNSGWPHLWRSV